MENNMFKKDAVESSGNGSSQERSVLIFATGEGNRVEEIYVQSQDFVPQINAKRARDSTLLADFKNDLEMEVAKSYNAVEESMYATYKTTERALQYKLKELEAILGRISILDSELRECRDSLGLLCQNVHIN